MKTIYTSRLKTFALLGAFLFATSCEVDIPNYISFPLYTWSDSDANGGNWKSVVLTSNEQVPITAPNDPASDAYKVELLALKSITASLTADQKSKAEYWSNNPILRWNEISRELAAKYNLAPAPNADGTYSVPSAATPDKYPLFPFAHPPYSCRAFAYLAVGQFDALISAWHYKYKFNRPAPSKVDSAVSTLWPATDLPSYPSDGATVAAVSQALLTALFPLEKDFLAQKAEECFNSLLWSGTNVQSDIDAGKLLGSEVAKLVLARAKTDGMSAAQTPKNISDSLKNLAFTTFGWSWTNQETPERPVGITPYFGKVKTWCVPDVKQIRPPVPPKPGSAEFQKAVDELKDIADNLTTDQRKIANWWSDGLGTYTPPGHWNRFACNAIVENKMNPLRTARVLAYLNMAEMDAGIACWDAKYYYHYPRPIQTIPGFKTILGTPNFPSYVSGHSTFSSAAAEVLAHFFPADASRFQGYAEEAGISRMYGGIHYRFDVDAGRNQGIAVANFVLGVAAQDGAE